MLWNGGPPLNERGDAACTYPVVAVTTTQRWPLPAAGSPAAAEWVPRRPAQPSSGCLRRRRPPTAFSYIFTNTPALDMLAGSVRFMALWGGGHAAKHNGWPHARTGSADACIPVVRGRS